MHFSAIYYLLLIRGGFFYLRKGLNSQQAAWAIKKYRSHRRIPEAEEVREALLALEAQEKSSGAI